MNDENQMSLEDAIKIVLRLLPALQKLVEIELELEEMELEKARELREIEKLDKAEWNLHCEQYGGEEVGSQACYDFLFALDWE